MINKSKYLLIVNFYSININASQVHIVYDKIYESNNNIPKTFIKSKVKNNKIFNENTFIKDVMKKFTLSISLSILSSIILNLKYSEFFDKIRIEKEKSSISFLIIGSILIFASFQIMFMLSHFFQNSFVMSILFYLKAITFGGLLSILYIIFPKEKIFLAFFSSILAFTTSFVIEYVFNKDLTNFTILAFISIALASTILIFGLGIKFLYRDINHISKYINTMSMSFSILSIIMSMFFLMYTINNLKINYKNISNDILKNNPNFICDQYFYADKLTNDFINIFLEILDLMCKKENDKYYDK